MPTIHTLHIITPDTSSSLAKKLDFYVDAEKNSGGATREYVRRLTGFLNGVAGGSERAALVVEKSDSVIGTGTLTFTAPADGDVFAVGGAVLTGKTGSISGNQFQIVKGNDALTARNAADAINAFNTGTVSTVWAGVSGAVVTVYALSQVNTGSVALSGNAANARIISGSAALSAGTGGTVYDLHAGYRGSPVSYPAGSTS